MSLIHGVNMKINTYYAFIPQQQNYFPTAVTKCDKVLLGKFMFSLLTNK